MKGLILKLKFQYFGPLMQRVDSLEKILMLGKTEGRRRRGRHRVRWLDGLIDSMDMNLGELHEIVRAGGAWHAAVHGVTKSWTQHWLNNYKNNIIILNEAPRIQNTNSVNYMLPVWKYFFFLRFWAQGNLSCYQPMLVFSLICTLSDFHRHPLNLHEIPLLFLANSEFAFPVTNTLPSEGLSVPCGMHDVCAVLSTTPSGILRLTVMTFANRVYCLLNMPGKSVSLTAPAFW